MSRLEGTPLSDAQTREIAAQLRLHPEGVEVLQSKDQKFVCRLSLPGEGTSVILKLWSPRDRLFWLRRAVQRGPAVREVRIMEHLRQAGVRVPRVLGFAPLGRADRPYRLALIVEDLGAGPWAPDVLKGYLAAGDEAEVERFDAQVIETTASLLAARVVDEDHALYNFLVAEDGELVRIDFEGARAVRSPERALATSGRMLGILIGTYAFAAQPDVDCVRRFAARLRDRLQPPPNALAAARQRVDAMMDLQRDTRIDLGW